MIGQQVAVIINGRENAGYRRVVWNGLSSSDTVPDSGLYFVKMEAKGVISGKTYSSIKKMLYLK